MEHAPRTLVVMRHAKAEQLAASDHARRLTRSGTADAVAAGRHLAATGVSPDRALISDASRTRDTWAAVAEGGGFGCPVEESGALYDADPDSALDLIRVTDASIGTLVVVGHNPTMAVVAQMLDDGEGDPAVVDSMATGFPTASVAVFRFDGEWIDLAGCGARVVGFHVARA